MENMTTLSWISIILSTLTPMIIGMIYYSKPLFQKAWMDSIGMTEEKRNSGNMAVVTVVSLLMSFLLSFFLINFNNMPGQEAEFDSFGHGFFHGVFILIFVAGPVIVTKSLYAQITWKGILIDLLYWGLTLGLMGGILDAMNHWPNEIISV